MLKGSRGYRRRQGALRSRASSLLMAILTLCACAAAPAEAGGGPVPRAPSTVPANLRHVKATALPARLIPRPNPKQRSSQQTSRRDTARAKLSRTAFHNLSGAAALALGRRGILAMAARRFYEPLMLKAGERVVRILDSKRAVVRVGATKACQANGPTRRSVKPCIQHPTFLTAVSTLPMFVKRNHRERLVDLALKATSAGLRPTEPLVPLTIHSGSPSFRFDRLGVGVGLQGASGGFGRVGRSAWASNVLRDTDIAVQPLAVGAEMWLQLRSPHAPQAFTLPINLPAGAQVHAVRGGAIGITSGSKVLLTIPGASAADAVGAPVDTSLRIAGRSLVLQVEHRRAGIVYPVTVDPIFAANSCNPYPTVQDQFDWNASATQCPGPSGAISNTGPGGTTETFKTSQGGIFGPNWAYATNGSFGTGIGNWFWGNGIYIWTNPNQYYSSNQFAEYIYQAPPGAFIQRVDFGFQNHLVWNTNSSSIFEGIWNTNAGAWQPGQDYQVVNYAGRTLAAPNFQPAAVTNETDEVYVGNGTTPDSSVKGAPGNLAAFGLQINTPGTRTSSAADWAFLYGATIWLYDQTPPTMTSTPPASSSQWTNDGGKTYTATPGASDNGVGMKYFNLAVAHGNTLTNFQTATNPCAGDHTGGYCPGSWSTNIQYQLPEGNDTVAVQPFDAVVNGGAGQSWTAKIDRTAPPPPTISGLTNGQAVQQGGQTLTINDLDPPANGADASSGPASVSIQVDGGTATSQPCTGQCTWTVPASLAEGNHTISVTATDGAGNTGGASTVSFVVDSTEPAVDLSGGAWDTRDTTLSSNTTDVQVDASDDNDAGTATSGVTRAEVLVDGTDPSPSTNLFTQPCPNGGCPLSHDFQLNLPNGDHQIEVDVTDAAGNVAQQVWPVTVNSSWTPPPCSQPDSPSATCTTDSPPTAPPTCTVATPTPGAADPNSQSYNIGAAEQTVQKYFPQGLQPSVAAVEENQTVAPAIALVGSLWSSQQSLVPASFSSTFPGFGVGSGSSSICLNLQSVSSSAGQGKLEPGNGLLYPDTAPSTGTLVRPTPLGVQTVQLLGNGAPTSSTWHLTLPPGDQIQQLDDGALAITDPSLPTVSSGAVDPEAGAPPSTPDPFPVGPSDRPAGSNPGPDDVTDADMAATPPDDSLEQDPTATQNQYQTEDFERQEVDRDTDGQAIAFIMPPSAHDANGTAVPTSMSTDGSSTATMTTDTSAGGYSYPITTYNTTATMARNRGGNPSGSGARFGFADANNGFFSSPNWTPFHKSPKFKGALHYIRTGVSLNTCDPYDGVTGGSRTQSLAAIPQTDNSFDGTRCRNSAEIVRDAINRGYLNPGNDVIVALDDDCNTRSDNPCKQSALPSNCNKNNSLYAHTGVRDPKGYRPEPVYWTRFRCSMLALMNTPPFNKVRSWDAYNEPDLGPSKPFDPSSLDNRARQAAQEWILVQKLTTAKATQPSQCAPRPGCTIAAFDAAHLDKTYLGDYQSELRDNHHQKPPVWAFHPYNDVLGANGKNLNNPKTRKNTGTYGLIERLANGWNYPDIWLDESGVELQDGVNTTPLLGNVGNQLSAAARFLSLPSLAPKVSETPGRRTTWRPIKRVLYYEWQSTKDERGLAYPGPNPPTYQFDSALMKFIGADPNGNPLAGPPRAAFCKLAYANKSTIQNACIGQADGR